MTQSSKPHNVFQHGVDPYEPSSALWAGSSLRLKTGSEQNATLKDGFNSKVHCFGVLSRIDRVPTGAYD